jgi:PAS domain-containing protein
MNAELLLLNDWDWLARMIEREALCADESKAKSPKSSKARCCDACRRAKRACEVPTPGAACRRCVARHCASACTLNTDTSTQTRDNVDDVDVEVLDRRARAWLAAALNRRGPPRQLFGVVARFGLRFDFDGELLVDSCNAAACALLGCEGDATLLGVPADAFMRCRRVMRVAYDDVPKETRFLEGECRLLQLRLPGDCWTRVHCFGSMSLSESPFDDKMWVRAMYVAIVNVFSA